MGREQKAGGMNNVRMCWAVERWVQIAPNAIAKKFVAALGSMKKALRWIAESGNDGDAALKVDRYDAVHSIRNQVYERDGRACVRCGDPLTFEMMHMHERVHRGKGGEISVENSECQCYGCHEGPTGAHGARRPQFSKKVMSGELWVTRKTG